MYLKGTVKHYYIKITRSCISHNERIVAKITSCLDKFYFFIEKSQPVVYLSWH